MPRRRLFSLKVWKTRIVFWSGALAVGLSATFLALGSDIALKGFRAIVHHHALWPFLLTPLGFAIIAYVTRRFFPGAEGSGIPQAIASLSLPHKARDEVLSLPIALGKSVLILFGLLCGASIGREGPTVHVGASIMYAIGRYAHFSRQDLERGLILAGGAAGIAAAFNTPLAGVVFAIEEMSRSFEERTSGTVLTAVIVAGMTAMMVLGNYPYFGTVYTSLDILHAWIAALACGIVGGALGGTFSALLIWGNRYLSPLHTYHPWGFPAACGLAVATIGYVSGGSTFGTGYEEAHGILTGEGETSVLFPYLKMLASLFSYWSGIPGGIFAPSLATGSGVGKHLAFLIPNAPAEAIAILAMVAYFSGVVQTPITAFVIVMEMTDNEGLLLPLMAASFIAYGTSRLLCPEPVYRALAKDFLKKPRGAS